MRRRAVAVVRAVAVADSQGCFYACKQNGLLLRRKPTVNFRLHNEQAISPPNISASVRPARDTRRCSSLCAPVRILLLGHMLAGRPHFARFQHL